MLLWKFIYTYMCAFNFFLRCDVCIILTCSYIIHSARFFCLYSSLPEEQPRKTLFFSQICNEKIFWKEQCRNEKLNIKVLLIGKRNISCDLGMRSYWFLQETFMPIEEMSPRPIGGSVFIFINEMNKTDLTVCNSSEWTVHFPNCQVG